MLNPRLPVVLSLCAMGISAAALVRSYLPRRAIAVSQQPGINLNDRIAGLKFKHVPLRGALEALGREAGVNIVVNWKGLQDLGVTEGQPVNLDLHDASVLGAVEAVLDQASPQVELGYHLDHDVIHVDGAGARPPATNDQIARIYDVQDLIDLPDPPPVAQTRSSGLMPNTRPGPTPAAEADEGGFFIPAEDAREARLSHLAELFRYGPKSLNVQAWAGRIFVIASRSDQLDVQTRLAELRVQAKSTGTFPVAPARWEPRF
jgi:hypothetical protein